MVSSDNINTNYQHLLVTIVKALEENFQILGIKQTIMGKKKRKHVLLNI